MTFLEIEAFLKIAQCGSFSAAAEKLYITQPALGRRIRALEEELGYSLFIRNKGVRHVELTRQGRAFLEQITSAYPLDRTDFYVDMAGEAVRYSQEERTENHVIVVQLVTVLVCFPLLHALGSRSGIFPAFFPTVRREKAGRN